MAGQDQSSPRCGAAIRSREPAARAEVDIAATGNPAPTHRWAAASEQDGTGQLVALLRPFLDDAESVAAALLVAHGSLSRTLACEPASMRRTPGMTEAAARHLASVRSFIEAVARERLAERPLIGGTDSLDLYLRATMRGRSTEQARGLFLDRKNRLLRDVVLAEGTIDQCPLYEREVVRSALAVGASAMILVHNHPSGDPEPSLRDVETTRKLRAALSLFEIILHDHVIVGDNEIVSLRNRGMI